MGVWRARCFVMDALISPQFFIAHTFLGSVSSRQQEQDQHCLVSCSATCSDSQVHTARLWVLCGCLQAWIWSFSQEARLPWWQNSLDSGDLATRSLTRGIWQVQLPGDVCCAVCTLHMEEKIPRQRGAVLVWQCFLCQCCQSRLAHTHAGQLAARYCQDIWGRFHFALLLQKFSWGLSPMYSTSQMWLGVQLQCIYYY